jgi:MFS family permease
LTAVGAVAAEAVPAPSVVRRFVVANAIDALGSGLFVPVTLLYFIATTPLSTVRVGLALSIASLLSIPFGLPVGSLVDRFGAKPVMQAGHVLNALGFAGYLLVGSFSGVLLSAWIVGLGRACFLGSYGVAVTALSEAGGRERAFGRFSAIRNLGMAGGGLLAGLAISIGTHSVYTSIIVANVASYLVALVLMVRVPNTRRPSSGRAERAWRAVLSDRPYRVVLAAQFCLTIAAFALYFVWPVYVTRELGLPGWLAGGLFTLNALLVGFAQSGAVRAVTGLVRSRVLAAGHYAFGVGYLVMLAALHRPAGLAGVLVVAGTLVYTAGELLISPTTLALASEAAPDHVRGRYLAMNQLSRSLATALSPTAFTFLLARGPGATWLTLITLAAIGVSVSAIAGRALPEARDRIGRRPQQTARRASRIAA